MPGLSEFELIATLLKPLAENAPGAFSLSDDAALLPDAPPGYAHVVTKDALAIGIHMRADDPPGDMARKSLRVNLSDLAAMGAHPVGFFLALCLGQDTDETFVKAFIAGLASDVDAYSVPLMGGDIIRQPGPFTISITAIGAVPKDKVLRRDGANVGDSLWVSGTIGEGALGLIAADGKLPELSNEDRATLIERYRIPEPRLALGAELGGLATACIDISDGLVSDVGHICRASTVGCTIDASAVPLSSAAQAAIHGDAKNISTVLTGGDDYELAFAMPDGAKDNLLELSARVGVPVTCIGSFETGENVEVLDRYGARMKLTETGYKHL
ncbi:MAG: thiamine-phosphate kinase [Alphaproteobacteria bacterium]|nr:thiamine-phosphate kinase [Alphaproteobacteria bacterium]